MKLLKQALSYLPTPLPTGMTEFKDWQDEILSLSKVPDNDSTRFASAVMILHLDATTDRKAKRYFIKALNKSAANEIANSVAMDLKKKQQERAEAEKALKLQAQQNVAQRSQTQETNS